MKRYLLVFLLAFWLLQGESVLQAQHFSPVIATRGMVVSADSLASAVGKSILQKGGNAVDAAVAVAFTLAVTYPNAGNIGGGGFMLIRTPQNKIFALDYREKAPLAAYRDMYLDAEGHVIENASLLGFKASGVPGTVRGLWAVHHKFGKLKWRQLLEPAINYAQNGFRLNRYQAWLLAHKKDKLSYCAATKKIFFKDDSSTYAQGEILRQTDLAKTFQRIALYGYKEFYFGQTAQLIAKQMKEHGGLITLEDLHKYKVKWRKPIRVDYRGFSIYSMPLPSSGGVLLAEILHVLQPFSLKELGHNSAQYIHLLTETERFAYRDRALYLGDPDFVQAPLERLLSAEYADSLRCQLSLLKAGKSDSGIILEEAKETTHFSVADAQGWAVSNTFTLNGNYGSGIVIEGTGILMNNEMDDFSIKSGAPNQFGLVGNEANAIAPEKRMLSSMTPTIVLRNDSLFMVLGSPGGSTIITSVLQVLLNVIDFGMNIRRAVEAPRFHHQWLPDVIEMEQFGFSNDTKDNLRNMGYRLTEVGSLGFVQAIRVKNDLFYGWSDPRSPGKAIGF